MRHEHNTDSGCTLNWFSYSIYHELRMELIWIFFSDPNQVGLSTAYRTYAQCTDVYTGARTKLSAAYATMPIYYWNRIDFNYLLSSLIGEESCLICLWFFSTRNLISDSSLNRSCTHTHRLAHVFNVITCCIRLATSTTNDIDEITADNRREENDRSWKRQKRNNKIVSNRHMQCGRGHRSQSLPCTPTAHAYYHFHFHYYCYYCKLCDRVVVHSTAYTTRHTIQFSIDCQQS